MLLAHAALDRYGLVGAWTGSAFLFWGGWSASLGRNLDSGGLLIP